ncbi:MAG: murein biosynthesis integral membrane protein MurJ [Paracoccaceae bacterium]|jgi:putative peptidoglycan lipid II flippase
MKPIRLVRGFLTVGAWTLLSRIAGFVRDQQMANYLGTGPVAEAFLVAFTLPNMFRRFFAEGAFNTAFVPMFSKKLEGGEDAKRFADQAFTGLALVVALFSVVAILGMRWLVLAMAGGFAGDARLELAIKYGNICFPYIFFISLTALLSGLLNAGGRFVAAAGAPVLLNIIFIVMTIYAAHAGWDIGLTLAWSTPLTGLAQLALVWVAAWRMGYPLRFVRPRFTADLKRLVRIAAPSVLAGGVVQVNLLVGRQVGSYFDGAIAWLSYADRLYQLPLGTVGIAIGIVLLPDLSRRLKADDVAGSRWQFSRATEFALFLTVPAAVALVVIALPLISVLYERGAFTAADTWPTALTLAVYGAGLPAFVLQKVLQPLYFAREDTRTPFRFAVHSMIVNALLAVGLAPFLGFIAAAIGTTLSGWIMTAQLWYGARRMGEAARLDERLWSRLPRIVLASLLMGAALWALMQALGPELTPSGHRYLALTCLCLAGLAAYAVAALLLGAVRLQDLKSSVSRSR